MSSLPEDRQPVVRPSPAEEENYFAAIERHFVSLRGSPLFITPREWQLIYGWHQRQIPLRVVIDGLNRALEKQKTTRRIRGLAYCRQSVESAYRRFCEALAGTESTADSGEEVSMARLHLRDLEGRIVDTGRKLKASQPSLMQAIERSAARLSVLASGPLQTDGFPELERELGELETALVQAAESSLGEAERQGLRDEADRTLERFRSRMPDEVYVSAARSAYLKRVREKFGIPPLSLFYM